MALQLVLGGSGSGKSTWVFKQVIEQSVQEEEKNFLILVPDQFTMQTQMDLVTRHPMGGIMNIDVLSFGRLAYRIMEERGGSRVPVLDDTGKSLVLRRVAEEKKDQLPVLGSHLKKQGYIHQVKSALSEFMQYKVGETELDEMLKQCENRGSLHGKLKDLKELHRAFTDYLADRFITTEGTYERLARQLKDSKLIEGSVVVLDGFTGFTPVQYPVIEELLRRAETVIVTLTLEEGQERQQLFELSRKTRKLLEKLASDAGKEVLQPIRIERGTGRFQEAEQLQHLEKYLFSTPLKSFHKETEQISLWEADTVEEEVAGVCRSIRLLLEKGYCYRDIAVISPDPEVYKLHVEELFEQYAIPFFLDHTRAITLNPFIEYIRSVVAILTTNYSYESMFHYLRSGMTGITRQETDRIENYCLAFGIRGKKAWKNLWVRIPDGEDGMEELERLNQIRGRIMEALEVFTPGKKAIKKLAEELYHFLTATGSQERLKRYEEEFCRLGDRSKEREYAQIYRLVMELLDRIVALLGEEEMSWEEFGRLLDSGFEEIQVGIIPQVVDKIVVGDMERTRLGQIKALFFLGMNEGKIPRVSDKGGILSQMDRDFLEGCGWELAPTARNQLFIQRFYLYLNVTKPSQRLYLSYAGRSDDGKTMKPSYFVDLLKRMYPKLETGSWNSNWEVGGELPHTLEEERMLAGDLIGQYRGKQTDKKQNQLLLNILTMLKEDYPGQNWVEDLLDGGFFAPGEDRISKETAQLLYGSMLMSSVSRLEKMAACAYAHFLRYGLELRQREEYTFEAMDMGNLYHGVLELFFNRLADKNYTWNSFSEEEGRALLKEVVEEYAIQYGDTILYSNATNGYLLEKMEEILWRTVKTLRFQLEAGHFSPKQFELSFSALEDLESVTIQLNEKEKLRLGGRIDRVDTLEKDDRIYVKVMDYKSGSRQFQLASFYHGLQLQLVVYLQAAMELEQKKNPEKRVLPGAFLYYHIADPFVEREDGMEAADIEREVLKKLKVTGIINEEETVVHGIDQTTQGQSLVAPIGYNKDGSLSRYSSVMEEEQIQLLLDYSRKKAAQLGNAILRGDVSMNPGKMTGMDSCAFCEFKQVCAFDEKIPGFGKRQLDELSNTELWEKIREEVSDEA